MTEVSRDSRPLDFFKGKQGKQRKQLKPVEGDAETNELWRMLPKTRET